MKIYALIGVGGFFGALVRYAVSTHVDNLTGNSFPFGTLIVNVAGCFLLGFCIFFLESNPHLSDDIKFGLGTGFLGAFTTFSTFGVETHKMLQDSQYARLLFNIGGNVILGLLAVILSFHLVKVICQS